MGTPIFSTIDELKAVIKINAALPWESISPYINDAKDIYLAKYIGDSLIAKIESGSYPTLLTLVRRALGPLTLMLAAPELGISIGDAGITVQNDQGKRSPANEAKIAAATDSFRFRGFQAMERLLAYLTEHAADYKEWGNSRYAKQITGVFVENATTFQDVGLVNIDYSIITYHLMLPTIQALQARNVRELLGSTLYEVLVAKHEISVKEKVLIGLIVQYLANKTAELYTSQASKEQSTSSGTPDFKPIIRPLYQDESNTGNFFGDQATYYAGRIKNYVFENAADLGTTVSSQALDFNSKDKKIFTSL